MTTEARPLDVDVTAAHIEGGARRRSRHCPLALAFRDALAGYGVPDLRFLGVSIGGSVSLTRGGRWVDVAAEDPAAVAGFVHAFDEGRPVAPARFRFRVPPPPPPRATRVPRMTTGRLFGPECEA
jgi:hypothetical protein